MKYQLIILPAVLIMITALQACNNQPDYKVIRQQVVDVHDKIMREDEELMSDKAKLRDLGTPAALQKIKTASPAVDTSIEKIKITSFTKQLDSISDSMSDWMAGFNPDVQGKTNDQAVTYFEAEKVKVMKLDSTYRVILKGASDYLKKFGIKTDTAMKAAPMKMKM